MTKQLRPIRSFVRREGRMTTRQQRALDQHWTHYGLSVDQPIDYEQLFGRPAKTILEIGFGMGASLLTMAKQHPESNYIGVEVFRSGVGALLADLAEQQVENVRVFCHDAVEVLQKAIQDNSLDAVCLFFPDPWPKKRHHKRRILQPDFVRLVSDKLIPGGVFHCATDWHAYAEHMLEVLAAEESLHNLSADNSYSPRPDYRPLTKFELRGQRLGHGVWDLLFQKKAL